MFLHKNKATHIDNKQIHYFLLGNNLAPSVADGGECILMFDLAGRFKKLYVFGHVFSQRVLPKV